MTKRFFFFICLIISVAVPALSGTTNVAYMNFARNSTAFLDGVQYNANIEREKEVLSVSESDGVIVNAGGVGGAQAWPKAVINGVMYGITSTTTRACKSTDGITWTEAGSTESLTDMCATPGGNLLGWNQPNNRLYRSTDGAAAWTEVKPKGLNAFSPDVALMFRWSLATNGTTMLLAEYGQPSAALSGRFVFKSTDDGITWTKTLDADTLTSIPDCKILHWHQVGYHAATKRWVASGGDETVRDTIAYATDADLLTNTWRVLHAPNTTFSQPLGGFIDYGDPTYLMCGDDGPYKIQKLNVLTGQTISVYDGLSHLVNTAYVFDMAYYNGVFYAMVGTTDIASTFTQSIIVSNDGINWAVYHNFKLSEKISDCYFAGYLNGKLHFLVRNNSGPAYRHFKISPAVVSLQKGIVISPAAMNLLSENDSSVETNIGNWMDRSGGLTVTQTAECVLHGIKSVKVVASAGQSSCSLVCAADTRLEEGKTYVAMMAVRGDNTTFNLRLGFSSGAFKSDMAVNSIDENWKWVYSNPYTVPKGQGGAQDYELSLSFGDFPAARTFYIDCAQIIACPIKPWQIGGNSKAADVLAGNMTTPPIFTDTFAVCTLNITSFYASTQNLYIKTWKFDAANFVSLYYNPGDCKFYIQRTIAAKPQPPVAATPQYWQGNALLKFAFQSDSAGINLTIQNGNAAETITDAAAAAINSAAITTVNGDANNSNQFPGVFLVPLRSHYDTFTVICD